MTKQEILSRCCFRKNLCNRGMRWRRISPIFFNKYYQIWGTFNKKRFGRCETFQGTSYLWYPLIQSPNRSKLFGLMVKLICYRAITLTKKIPTMRRSPLCSSNPFLFSNIGGKIIVKYIEDKSRKFNGGPTCAYFINSQGGILSYRELWWLAHDIDNSAIRKRPNNARLQQYISYPVLKCG